MLGVSAEEFPPLVRSIEARTAARLRDGEADHLIFYILQSSRFTHRPRIEPALSAREYVEKGKIPAAAETRMRDFLKALDRPAADERLAWFRQTLAAPQRAPAYLRAQYARAMRSLYGKEFEGGAGSAWYQTRGHSSDTRIESSYALWNALAVLKARDPALRLQRVLIVGPGLDFAPRTDLIDAYPPQSYQPYAVEDALLSLGLADPARLRIHCVDINPRVVASFTKSPAHLILFREWDDPDYRQYFDRLGSAIGSARPIPNGKSLDLSRAAAARVTAAKLNVITERYDPSPGYDLIVATNVLVYFDRRELLLALANIRAMLAPGGYFIHNETRPEVEAMSSALGFPPVQGGTVRLSTGPRPLFDSFVIQQPSVHLQELRERKLLRPQSRF